MDQEHIAEIRTRVMALCRKAKERFGKLPVTGQVVVGGFLVVAVFMAIYAAFGARNATLRLKVQHSFRSAQLQVWVDDDSVYSGKLVGSIKKKFGLFGEYMQGGLSETLSVPSGSHRVKVRVVADDGTVQEDAIDADFSRDTSRTLSVVARHSDVELNWQGGVASAQDASPDEPPGNPSWFARYAGTLILTAVGSIFSAVTGYAVRELPGYIRARQSAASQEPKAQS